MTARSWSDLLSALVAGQDLAVDESAWAMEEILAGSATPSQIAGFAVALRAKGESVDELAGLVATMYAHAETIDVDGRVVDIVGTGGDRAKTVNISTMSAVAMAGAGVPVVKHGGRAASSASGAADVLEELGVRLDVPVDRVPEIAEQIGITFCFAPVFHSSLRFAAVPRRELGIATTFNLLGPLANPARPGAMAVGVADRQIAPVMAGVLARRDVDALVFRGDDGLDEITTTTTSTIWVVGGAEGARSVTERSLDPRELGIEFSAPEALRGGDAAYNASVFRRVLDGEHGPVRDAVVLNAAAGLCAHEAAEDDLLERLRRNAERVRSAIDSGDAARLLNRWIETTAAIVGP